MVKLSIIIPVYNEEKTILKVIDGVKRIKIKDVVKEIIIVDDFSTDRTRDILKKMKDKSIENQRRRESKSRKSKISDDHRNREKQGFSGPENSFGIFSELQSNLSRILGLSETKSRQFSGHQKSKGFFSAIKIFYHKKNMGKGAAIRTALENATGGIISIQDADLEYDPNNIKKLIKPILDSSADVVYGSRFLGKKLVLFGKKRTPLPLHWIGNRILTFLTNILYFNSVTDMETGCKVFKRNVIKNMNLKAKRFDFEPEVTAKILKKGYKIKELPIKFSPRTFKEGKKITWRDGIKAAYYLLKYRLMD